MLFLLFSNEKKINPKFKGQDLVKSVFQLSDLIGKTMNFKLKSISQKDSELNKFYLTILALKDIETGQLKRKLSEEDCSNSDVKIAKLI